MLNNRDGIGPQSLDAVILIANAYKKQVAFYRDVLDLKVIEEYTVIYSILIGCARTNQREPYRL